MRLKALLAASTALALVAAAPGAQAGGLYVSVFGGMNMLADDSGLAYSDPDSSWASDADTGFVLGGAIGTSLDRWATGLRTELEVSYRRNDLGGTWDTTDTDPGTLSGNMSTFAVMANVWYDFDIGSKIRPYVGGGAGWARVKGDMVAIQTDGDTETYTDFEGSGFAWQLGIGGRYEVASGIDLGLGYRYFHGPNFEDFFGGYEGSLHNDNHTVQVELTFDIQ